MRFWQRAVEIWSVAHVYATERLPGRRDHRFALYRILGNDLPPRHLPGQTLANLRFILEQEAAFPHCTKYWIVNRIVDVEVERQLIGLLTEHSQPFLHIPFHLSDYAACDWDVDDFTSDDYVHALGDPNGTANGHPRIEYRIRLAKNRYAMNNNGARNAAIDHGRQVADFILPFDGSSFLTPAAWSAIEKTVRTAPRLRYLIVPMARIGGDPERLLRDGIPEEADEEPQLGLHALAEGRFDDRLGYGHWPKVDLLARIGYRHRTINQLTDAWDLPPLTAPPDGKRHAVGGRVARLPSGYPEQETGPESVFERWTARNRAITDRLDALDHAVLALRLAAVENLLFDASAIAALKSVRPGSGAAILRARILANADAALHAGTGSVRDKSRLAASGDPHDYHSPAPYWWPDPATPDGKPYVRRDGDRVPEATQGRVEADAFDYNRLCSMIEGIVSASLAWKITGERRYAAFAADYLRVWFLRPETAMNPNFSFAQVRAGHADDTGQGAGLIEIQHLPALLDAFRWLIQSDSLSAAEQEAMQVWLANFAQWMTSSPQGTAARQARNNIGTFYDAERLALSIHLNDAAAVSQTLRRMRVRLKFQFDAAGEQPGELARTRPGHYSAFNLFGWAQLTTIARSIGVDIRGWGDQALRRATERLVAAGAGQFAAEDAVVVEEITALAMREDMEAGRAIDPVLLANTVADDGGLYWQLYDVRYFQ